MILNKNINNIKYVFLDSDRYTYNAPQKITFADYIDIVDFGKRSHKYYSNPYYWKQKQYFSSEKYMGIFLGSNDDVKNEINKKINPNGPGTLKKIYFDPLCKYPRFKVNALSNIKRCLNPDKADSVIIHFNDLDIYESHTWVNDTVNTNILILYSNAQNTYYLVDYYPEKLSNKTNWKTLNTLINQNGTDNTSKLHFWASALVNANVLPSDCTIYYYGNIILLDNEKFNFLDNLYNKYMQITYDTELDKFINDTLQKPGQEELDTINRMLASSDNSVVGMGLKLLSSYDLSNSVCSIGMILANNWMRIADSNVSKSVGFEQVLSSLKLEKSDFAYGNNNRLMNRLYSNSTDEEDKKHAKNIIISQITQNIQKQWENYAKEFSNLDLSFKFTVE